MTTDAEIRRVVDFWTKQGVPDYEMAIKEKIENSGAMDMDDGEDDELLEAAIEIIRQTQRASTSSLQRRLRIGYTRAARLMDILEERGVVGPARGSDPREILIDLDGEIPQNKPDELGVTNSMATLGQILKEAREKKNVTASQAAAATRMKIQTVEALERDDFSRMAAPMYAKGFIKLYAEYLGLDAAPLIREYDGPARAEGAPAAGARERFTAGRGRAGAEKDRNRLVQAEAADGQVETAGRRRRRRDRAFRDGRERDHPLQPPDHRASAGRRAAVWKRKWLCP